MGGERRADSSPGSGVGRGRAGQQVQTRAHLGDRRLISLACRRVDEPSGKELFQPQVVIQDHIEQGTLGGRTAGRQGQTGSPTASPHADSLTVYRGSRVYTCGRRLLFRLRVSALGLGMGGGGYLTNSFIRSCDTAFCLYPGRCYAVVSP